MEKLLKMALKGNKDSFIQLIKLIEKKLYFIAKSRLENEEDIKDVIQETICQTYKNLKNLKNISKFDTWIVTILINNCNQLYRKNKKYSYTIYEKDSINKLHSINEYVETDTKIDFLHLLNLLNENDRTIFVLYYSDNYTTNQISKILKINENTIKSKIKRAKEKIRNHIERCEENERKIK